MNSFISLVFGFMFMSPFNISGDSMEPMLSHGDVIMVDNFAYVMEEPERGDVIVFYGTDDSDKFFVKRIIGLPEERILIREGRVHLVEGEEELMLEEPYLPDPTRQSMSMRSIDGTSYEVPDDHYFVLGDNRNSSYDSRTWDRPFIPEDNIVGKYSYIIY